MTPPTHVEGPAASGAPAAPPGEIELARVHLRRHRPEDAPGLFAAVDSDRTRLGRFLPWVAAVARPEDEAAFVADMERAWERGTLFDYGVYPRDALLRTAAGAPTVAGTIGAHSIDWPRRLCELGYWLHAAWEGRGLVQEAIAGLERALFAVGFERIEIRCDAENARSAAAARRAGYVLEGRLRHHRPRGDGSWADTLVFARLVSDPPRPGVPTVASGERPG